MFLSEQDRIDFYLRIEEDIIAEGKGKGNLDKTEMLETPCCSSSRTPGRMDSHDARV